MCRIHFIFIFVYFFINITFAFNDTIDTKILCNNHSYLTRNEEFNDNVVFVQKIQDNNVNSNMCPNVKKSHHLLSRKRRSLSFPEGSNFVITLSLVKAILIGLPLGWNQALEMDIFYKTPGTADLLRSKQKFKLGHRQRRDIWNSFEDTLDYQGVNGKACIVRTICEAQQFLAPKDTILVHDLLRTLFSAPDIGGPTDIYTEASKLENCEGKACPFSLLELILSHDKASIK